MASKIKNIIIFTIVIAALILVYIFFIKNSSDSNSLVSSTNTDPSLVSNTNTSGQNSSITNDLLSVLLSVKNIKLDDSIFSNPAFVNLRDSSILLNPTGNEGRPNPFAPIGFENTTTPAPITPINPSMSASSSGASNTSSTPPTTKIPATKTPTSDKSTKTTL